MLIIKRQIIYLYTCKVSWVDPLIKVKVNNRYKNEATLSVISEIFKKKSIMLIYKMQTFMGTYQHGSSRY